MTRLFIEEVPNNQIAAVGRAHRTAVKVYVEMGAQHRLTGRKLQASIGWEMLLGMQYRTHIARKSDPLLVA
jgi:hypothetical protein